MALKSTVYKLALAVADMDRPYYGDHELALARHPSETEERLMVRILAFAMYADPALAFGNGLCVDDEPDLWQRDLTGNIERWIDVGQPDEKWIRKAAGRAAQVVLVSYGRAADVWWKGIAGSLRRFRNLDVVHLDADAVAALARLAERGMRLQATVQDGQVWLTNGRDTVMVEPQRRMTGGIAAD